jgi:hypothetical protein
MFSVGSMTDGAVNDSRGYDGRSGNDNHRSCYDRRSGQLLSQQ